MVCLILFQPAVIASPHPIYGQVEYVTGDPVVDALINVSSVEGFRITKTGDDGFWQVDVGHPLNWPVDTEITVTVTPANDDETWRETTQDILESGTLYVGVITINATPPNGSTDGNVSFQPPVAKSINQGFIEHTVGSTVFFDGLDSEDPDGLITGYRWDFNGDGIFDTEWSEHGIITHVFQTPGVYPTVLEVRDNDNLTDTVTITVDISKDPIVVEIIGPRFALTSEMNPFIYQLYSDITITNVTWMIDDQVVSFEQTWYHQFKKPGFYLLKVYLTDDANQTYHDVHQTQILLDTDKDLIADEIESKIGTPIWTKNNMSSLILNGNEHLLIDTDDDGMYNLFFNITAMNASQIKVENDVYLIDDDLDMVYEYKYSEDGLESYDGSEAHNQDNNTPGLSFVVIVGCVMITVGYLIHRKHHLK
jgi:hypothetical protein